MAYSPGMVQVFTSWLGKVVPPGGAVLELGEQVINPDVPPEALAALMKATGGVGEAPRRMADAFHGSGFTYRCIDLTRGEMVITADLNIYRVSAEWRGHFDLVTNMGTTEHVADQINVFRVVHDLTKPGGAMFHTVPFTGYFNHGLFNYQPAWFAFLAARNGYQVDDIGVSAPHLPYTIPVKDALPGSEAWRYIVQQSGMLRVMMRKVDNRPFTLFTDYDVTALGEQPLSDRMAAIMSDRYDLRVR